MFIFMLAGILAMVDLWLGLIPWACIPLVFIGSCVIWWDNLQRKRILHDEWIRRGACRYCGYDLTGNVSGICPECGRVFGPRQPSDAKKK